MSDYKWSIPQGRAITETDSNGLLSAGAGSGKTAVLTERIYHLVKQGYDLSSFLILTFTDAASAEMRTRIRERFLKDPSLGDCSSKLETAHIETFDSFCLFVVRKYALRLGVSPNIGVLDKTLLDIQRNRIRDEYITYLYKSRNSDFLKLVSKYCPKSDFTIRGFITSFCLKVENKLDKEKYLDEIVDKYFDKNRINTYFVEKYESMIKAIKKAINLVYEYEDETEATLTIEQLDKLLEKGKDFESLILAANAFSFPDARGKNYQTSADRRQAVKDLVNKYLIKEDTYGNKDEIIDQFMSTKEDIQTIVNVVREIEKRLDTFKKDKSSYAFADISSLAIKALEMEDIRKELSEFFSFILVDEYQDTSSSQELVINKLERNNVCMVGDIKQSIYRFRGADCSLFQEKYNKYKPEDNGFGILINLNDSFRSRKPIVDLVNDMFEVLMTPETNPIDYKDGHKFGYGLTDYDTLIDPSGDPNVKVYNYQLGENEDTVEVETTIIAKDIIYKIINGHEVYDKNAEGMRKCSFKDFAIIVDRGTQFDEMKNILSTYGIPTKVVYNEPVKNSEIVLVLKNLLIVYNACLTETYDESFKHAFVSVSRSFIWESKDQDIYDYVHNNTMLDSPLIQKVKEIVNEGRQLPIAKVMQLLINEFHIYEQINKLKHFSNNANKIELFINLSKNMDSLGLPLEGLISYLSDLDQYKLEFDYKDKDVGEDSVTIITIHRSKGLEYPVVYLPGLTSTFPTGGGGTACSFSDKYGPVLPITGHTKKSSFFNHMVKLEESKGTYEERLRLFYVAVTRAREQIVFLNREKENNNGVYVLSTVNRFQSFIKYLHMDTKYGLEMTYPLQIITKESDDKTEKMISIDQVNCEAIEIAKKKASKDKDGEVDYELLEFGNEIHYLLEIADFETKDTTYISDGRMRRYINNVLSSELFKNVKNSQVLHEYSFFDEKNVVSGIIDCLLLKEDEIDIIDFKLKNLDDDKYILQLHTYRDYIEQITDKKIGMYLISAITGEVKEIE